MTMERALADCRGFAVADAILSLWVFKKRLGGGFSATSIEVSDALARELRNIATGSLQAHTEIEDYSLVTQRNEASCLHVGADETTFGDLKGLVDEPAEEHRVRNDRDLKNCAGYVIRLRVDDRVLYCVKRVTDTWKTKKARSVLNVVFRANQLDLVVDQSFTIAKNLDFVVLDNEVLIMNKAAFETLLSYKIEYANSFSELRGDPVFAARFTDLQPMIDHVGTNTMHLRRMAVIHQKANYANPGYMTRLQQVNTAEGWNIQFDHTGRIVATEETMRTIMQVLLDHRLHSRLSLATYDVPSTAAIQP